LKTRPNPRGQAEDSIETYGTGAMQAEFERFEKMLPMLTIFTENSGGSYWLPSG
jgi:hypothetical protein